MGSVSYHTTFSHHHIGLRVDPRWVSSTPTVKGARLSHLLLTAGKFGLDNVQAEIHAETSLCFLSPSILFQKEVCVCTSCILYYGISRHIESQQIYSAAWSEAGAVCTPNAQSRLLRQILQRCAYTSRPTKSSRYKRVWPDIPKDEDSIIFNK